MSVACAASLKVSASAIGTVYFASRIIRCVCVRMATTTARNAEMHVIIGPRVDG